MYNTEKTKAKIVGNNTVSALTVNGTDIEHVDNFQYIGSYMSSDGVTYDVHSDRKSIVSVSTPAPHMEVKHN